MVYIVRALPFISPQYISQNIMGPTYFKLHLKAKTIIQSKKSFIHHMYRLIYGTMAGALKTLVAASQFSSLVERTNFHSLASFQLYVL